MPKCNSGETTSKISHYGYPLSSDKHPRFEAYREEIDKFKECLKPNDDSNEYGNFVSGLKDDLIAVLQSSDKRDLNAWFCERTLYYLDSDDTVYELLTFIWNDFFPNEEVPRPV